MFLTWMNLKALYYFEKSDRPLHSRQAFVCLVVIRRCMSIRLHLKANCVQLILLVINFQCVYVNFVPKLQVSKDWFIWNSFSYTCNCFRLSCCTISRTSFSFAFSGVIALYLHEIGSFLWFCVRCTFPFSAVFFCVDINYYPMYALLSLLFSRSDFPPLFRVQSSLV